MKKGREPVKAYKGFNKYMQCTPNGKIFQYEIGKEYKEDEANLCYCGFHACENPLDVLSYYNNIDDKFCEVELDKIDPNRNKDSKICGKKIKIGIEIGFLGLFKAGIEWIKNKTIFTEEDFKKLPPVIMLRSVLLIIMLKSVLLVISLRSVLLVITFRSVLPVIVLR